MAQVFTSSTQPRPSRLQKYTRQIAYVTTRLSTLYALDKHYNASAFSQNMWTLWTCSMITLDHKLNFTPEKSEKIPELHERVAQRMCNLLTSNSGLYIKIGQAIGINTTILPKAFQTKFSTLVDDASQLPYFIIHDVFTKELSAPPGGPDRAFSLFEKEVVASVSIAQVHKAKLKGKDEWVAVKIQKLDVGVQMEWGLAIYRTVMWMFERENHTLIFIEDFISGHLRQELEFEHEAENARRTTSFIESKQGLHGKVYIPKVHPKYSSKKVMVAEWIDIVRLSDRKGIRRIVSKKDPLIEDSIPQSIAFGRTQSIMHTMVSFSAQMFTWGWVHCDPHPSIIICPSPISPPYPPLRLIDYGLYIQVLELFKREWVDLWRGMSRCLSFLV
ncbi:ABC1 family protein C10F6.14c [Leucoagaricus sp. SymC.cos]|nr:ABC1 family protein C10F6.14c [Leucoagaricus sp. SymC.cos]